MKKVLSVILGFITILICVLSLTIFKIKDSNEEIENRQILTVWHIDTFEGGTGSRTSFLKRVCNAYSNKNKNILFLVSSHTVESANELIKKGEYPDLISYGVCSLNIIDRACEIKGFDGVFDGGVAVKKRYAISWCRGNYFHIKRGNGGEVFISENAYNSALASATYNGVFNANYKVYEPLTAYRNFVLTKNAELIGTGRDIVRLKNREISFTATALSGYNDLYQYISVTANDNKKIDTAKSFIKYLLSEEIQKKLTEISMFSVVTNGIYADEYFAMAEKSKFSFVPSFCITEDKMRTLKQNAINSYRLNSKEDFIKSLKQL